MRVNARTLIEFCNSNYFSDSEDDTSEEESGQEESQEESGEKEKNTITEQPATDKITIIVDSSNIEQYKENKNIFEWENIDFTELDGIVFDDSFSHVVKKKNI